MWSTTASAARISDKTTIKIIQSANENENVIHDPFDADGNFQSFGDFYEDYGFYDYDGEYYDNFGEYSYPEKRDDFVIYVY